MTHWIRILGSWLVALGIAVFVVSLLAAYGNFLYSLIINKDYVSAVILSSLSLVTLGYTLRKVFREPPQKI
jgi:uncharacterized membrane protein